MKRYRFLFLLAGILSFFNMTYAQYTEWTIPLISNYGVSVNAVQQDRSGRPVVCGYMYGDIDFNHLGTSDTLYMASSYDLNGFVAKYDTSGILIWKFALGSEAGGAVSCKDAAVDKSDNVYVTGTFQGIVDFDPGVGTFYDTATSYQEIFVAKYTSGGQFLYAMHFPAGPGASDVNSISLDKYNGFALTGTYQNSITIGGNTLSGGKMYVARFDSLGTVKWARDFADGTGKAVLIGSGNDVLLGGTYSNPFDMDPGTGTVSYTVNGSSDGFLLKLDSLGNYEWASVMGGTDVDECVSVKEDQSGNIYAFHTATPGFAVYTPFDTTLLSTVYWNTVLTKFNSDGRLLKSRHTGSPAGWEQAFALDIDENANLYLEGLYFYSFYPGIHNSGNLIENHGGWDVFVTKFDSSLAYQWGFGIGGNNSDYAEAISIQDNRLYFAGAFMETVDFNNSDTLDDLHYSPNIGGFFQKVRLTEFVDTTNIGSVYFNEDVVRDIDTIGAGWPQYFFIDSLVMYFIADDGIHGNELWKTDGTWNGTEMVKDINPNGDGFLYDPLYPNAPVPPSFTKAGDYIYFNAYTPDDGMELWRTDGTEAGTQMVIDLDTTGSANGYWSDIRSIDTTVYFFSKTPQYGVELWKTNGTSASTQIVKDISPGNTNSCDYPWLNEMNGLLIFKADNGVNGEELWRSDGTDTGTYMISELVPGSGSAYPQRLVRSGDKVFYTMTDPIYGEEVGVTDGTASGTHMVKDINPSGHSWPYFLFPAKNKCFFTANDGVNGWELWVSDGSDTGTYLVKDINPSGDAFDVMMYGTGFCSYGDTVFFSATDGVHGYELWKSDGTDTGTIMVKDLFPGPGGGYIWEFAVSDSTVFFSGYDGLSYTLWQTDGTEQGTKNLRGLSPMGSGYPMDMCFMNGYIFYTAEDPVWGRELWKYKLIDSIQLDTANQFKNISTMKVGETLQLVADFFPDFATDKGVNWSIIRGISLATIDQGGLITLTSSLSPGDTITVMVSSDDGSRRKAIFNIPYSMIGIKPIADQDMMIYPNPVSDILCVEKRKNSVMEYTISTLNGQIVRRGQLINSKNLILVSSLERGLYVLTVTDEKQSYSKKFVKK